MRHGSAMPGIQSFSARAKVLALLTVVISALVMAPAPASAQGFGISSFTTGAANNQAGAHSDYSTSFALKTDAFGNPIDQLKDVVVNLPAGVIGNPQAMPMCTDSAFQNFNCPSDAQVGVLNASFITSPGAQTTLISQVPNTTLTAAIGPCTFCGARTMGVASTAGMSSGDQLILDPGAADQDTVTIARVLDATDVLIAVTGFGVQNTHAAGTTIADSTITVANTAGFSGTGTVVIGSGADQETDQICFAPGDSTHLTLCDALTQMHSPGEPVVQRATIATAPIPIFNMQPDPGHVATLAASLLIATIVVEIDVGTPGHTSCDSSSCGLTAKISDISSLLSLQGTTLTLWGVPGDPTP